MYSIHPLILAIDAADCTSIFRQQQGAAFYWQVPSSYIYKPAAHISSPAGGPFLLEEKIV
jgi:hypothetical protein